MWPEIMEACAKVAWEMLPETLSSSKPRWMTEVSLCKFDVGTTPPTITDVHLAEGSDPSFRDIYVEFDVEWSSKSDIELWINPLPTAVGKLPGLSQLLTVKVRPTSRFHACNRCSDQSSYPPMMSQHSCWC